MTQIFVFGDSIAHGNWDIEGGWVQKIRTFLDTKAISPNFKNYSFVYNLGIDGDTSTLILKRVKSEFKARFDLEKDCLFIFEFGTNDSILSKKNHKKPVISKKIFEKNLDNLTNFAKKFTKKILFIGPLPVREIKTNPVSWNADIFYSNKSISEYNQLMKAFCLKRGILFLDLFEIFSKGDYPSLLIDGVHPNDEGHKKIYELVKETLKKENYLLELS
jgi:lysophospholipase L1-like esterase